MIWTAQCTKESVSCKIAVFSKLMSEIYDTSWYGTFCDDEIDFFCDWIKTEKTLEVGSGTGRVSLPLLERKCDVYGIEGSAEMIEVLHSKLTADQRMRFIHWNAQQTPYPVHESSFKFIIIPFSTFGLIHNNVDTEFLGTNCLMREFYRLLAPGGTVIINDYRTAPFDRTQVGKELPPWVHDHQHPVHGHIIEEQLWKFKIVPNRIFPDQIIRERRTRLISTQDNEILEEFYEEIPVWDTRDFPVLGSDAGFEYLGCENCHFHEDPSVHHIFRKPGLDNMNLD